mgnify:CR=1 FL=1
MEIQSNFIKTIIESDLSSGKHKEIITRFPPEPNGFLHIGHARAVIINFELAKAFGGYTNLRYDDTNPAKEDDIFVKAILADIRWLGYEPKHVLFASDYFEEMYQRAILLIKKGLAYVDHSSPEQMAKDRGNVNTPGIESIYRNRSVEENLDLFIQMKEGKFKEGECVLRAKIDMKSPNMNMRDPALYRISYAEHHNTGNTWCIYPMYDYAHPLEDAIEGITHSLCSLEFEDHRPLYDWCVRETEMPKVPRQIEFGRLSIENTVMSKRYLRQLVETHKVTGWDDPRMPTLMGLRRRGFTPEAIRHFILSTGLSKVNSTIGNDMLEASLRDDLSIKAPRAMAIINPLKVTITNYEDGKIEYFEVPNHPDHDHLGTRIVSFSKHLYIEHDDFVIQKPNKHYKRLAIHEEVRLFHTYFIKAYDVIKDEAGNPIEVLATYDPLTRSGSGFNERKPNGTIHFVEATEAIKAQFNFFGPMIIGDDSMELEDRFNEQSWTIQHGWVEKALANVKPEDKFQFIRNGFFNTDNDSTPQCLIFNEIVPLKSSYKG